MRITLRGYYAILALTSMADENGERPFRIEDITQRHPIPETFLLQIFQALRRSGLIRSRRGVGGGFTLARPAGRITLAEVIESVEGELLPSPADERTELRVRPPSWQALDAVWDEMRTKIRCVTGEYTLKDVAERINEREAEMYYI